MPEKKTIERARKDAREGKAPSAQVGEFVREEVEHVRQGKHGARSPKQIIAIGLSKARQAGVDLPPPTDNFARKPEKSGAGLRKREIGFRYKPSPKRSRAAEQALLHESGTAASRRALSKQGRSAARERKKR